MTDTTSMMTVRPWIRFLRLAAPVLIVCAVAIVFAPALRNGFVTWDDQYYVLNNEHIALRSIDDVGWFFTHSYYWSYIPLTMLSHALDYALWGKDPWGHHLTNLILHGLNALMFYILLYRILGRGASRRADAEGAVIVGAAVGTILFALHPLRAESVAWVSDRKDLLCTFFLLPLLYCYLEASARHAHRSARRWLLAALALHILALLSKTTALMVPILLLAVDIFLIPRRDLRSGMKHVIKNKIPFFAASMVVGLIGMASVPAQKTNFLVMNLSGVQKILLPFHSVIFPLGKLVWPAALSPVYDYPSAFIMGLTLLILVLLTLLCIVAFRLDVPGPLAAWLCYLIMSAPTAAFFASGIQPIADRYTYISMLSFAVLVGGWCAHIWGRGEGRVRSRARIVLVAAVLSLTVLMGQISSRQVGVWRDSLTLWQHAATIAHTSAFVQNNLGEALVQEDYLDDAIVAYTLATEAQPDFPDAHNNLGVAYLLKRDFPRGLAALARAAELFATGEPGEASIADVYFNMGSARWELGDREGALEMFATALRYKQAYPEVHLAVGSILLEQGDTLAAVRSLTRAAELGDSTARARLTGLAAGRGGGGL